MEKAKWQLPAAPHLVVLAALALAGCAATAHEHPTVPAQAQAQANPDPSAILQQMAQFLSSQPHFSVHVTCGYDSVQDDGRKLEFMEHRTFVVDRSKQRMRVDVEQSDGDRSLALFDGTTITAQDLSRNVYAQAAAKPTLDGSIAYFIQGLRMPFPLALLLVSTLPDQLDRRSRDVEYVEETSILGTPAHHIAARTDGADYQLWIAAGKNPLLLRVVLTYPEADGEPQYRAMLDDWNLAPVLRDSTFAFQPSSGATRIAFAPQVAPAAAKPSKEAKAR
ncbi:MAG TPA: DUF2092 domain-containing protein [Candidatus Binatia bacterium]